MSSTERFLDSSLDDVIKLQKKESKAKNVRKPANAKNAPGKRYGLPSRTPKPSITAKTNGGVGKAKQGPTRPLKKSAPPKLDPSNVMITKRLGGPIKSSTAPSPALNRIQEYLGKSVNNKQRRSTPSKAANKAASSSLSIRGLATAKSQGLSIRNDAGPATVLISNLCGGTSADDIHKYCDETFGPLLSCELSSSRNGRGCEARVEFEKRQDAMKCIETMDNRLVDGQVLRVNLVNLSSSHSASNASPAVRSMIGYAASNNRSSGKMYSDRASSASHRF